MKISQNELKRQHVFEQLTKIKSDATYENAIVTALLMDEELLCLKPITQQAKQLSTGYIQIDLFYPELNLAIEIDEQAHSRTIKEDEARDKELMDKWNIKCHRIRFWGEHQEKSIWDKLTTCKNKIKELQQEINPPNWHIVQHALSDAQEQHSNMIFRKINKPIYRNNIIDFNIKINPKIMLTEHISSLNISVYTGQTSEIATVITTPKNSLKSLGNGNYQVHTDCYINQEHPLNQSGFTSSNWATGKSTIYSNDLNLIVNSDSKVRNKKASPDS